MRTSELTPRQICQLYKSGEPTELIAQKAGITGSAVRWHLHNHKVKMRPRGSVPHKPKKVTQPRKRVERRISIAKMRELYDVQKLSVAQVAKAAGVSTATARNDLHKAGAHIRNRAGARGTNTLKISVAEKYHPAILNVVNALGGKRI